MKIARTKLAARTAGFTESVIREMTRQAMQYGAVNLAQGFPDFSAPAEIKKAAQDAIAADVNQYAITWGAKNLRNAIARQMLEWRGLTIDPESFRVIRWDMALEGEAPPPKSASWEDYQPAGPLLLSRKHAMEGGHQLLLENVVVR